MPNSHYATPSAENDAEIDDDCNRPNDRHNSQNARAPGIQIFAGSFQLYGLTERREKAPDKENEGRCETHEPFGIHGNEAW